MEFLAFFAICILTGIGWIASKICFGDIVTTETRAYFAPAFGVTICGMSAYTAAKIHQPWLIHLVCLIAVLCAIRYWILSKRLHRGEDLSLLRFTVLTTLCLYGMQILLYGLFSRVYPGVNEVGSLFNLTGTPPPDQMFAWHQAMFAAEHRQYPQDPFFQDMDLYDRPHLGGFLTLFFFTLFRLPLTEDHFIYPAHALRFYHCFWWLLNNLYLLGVAPLFKHLFGYRGAVIGVASAALGGFFLLCNAGAWMKFSAAYPFLLAFVLFLEGKGYVLQAFLCATSFYIHGSVLPFLIGFGFLQLLTVQYPVAGRRAPARAVAVFSTLIALLVGAWFVTVKWVGSKQPLFYYYVYCAGLTEAQTRPVAEIAKDFYARHTWASLSLWPVHTLLASLRPVMFLDAIKSWFWLNEPARFSDLASLSFASQRFCVECALGMGTAPIVVAGALRALLQKHSGKLCLCLYLVPTLIVALVYRIEWAFSLHILCLYHTLALFCWVSILRIKRSQIVLIGLIMLALEGIICVLFSDNRFLPVNGLRLAEVPTHLLLRLAAYVALVVVIVGAAYKTLDRHPASEGMVLPNQLRITSTSGALVITGKLLVGLLVVTLVMAANALYSLRFYPTR